jgi:hypothetical protein
MIMPQQILCLFPLWMFASGSHYNGLLSCWDGPGSVENVIFSKLLLSWKWWAKFHINRESISKTFEESRALTEEGALCGRGGKAARGIAIRSGRTV